MLESAISNCCFVQMMRSGTFCETLAQLNWKSYLYRNRFSRYVLCSKHKSLQFHSDLLSNKNTKLSDVCASQWVVSVLRMNMNILSLLGI